MEALADNGSYVLAEEGTRLLFFRRRIIPSWVAFVLGLLSVVALGNAVVQCVVGHLAAGGVLLLAAAACGLAARLALLGRRRAKAVPLDPAAALVVIDLEAQALLDGSGGILAPLDAVTVSKAMQVTSSARALRIAWPGGSLVAYRGDALEPGGSIDVPAAALNARGVPVAG